MKDFNPKKFIATLSSKEKQLLLLYQKHDGKRYQACDAMGISWNEFTDMFSDLAKRSGVRQFSQVSKVFMSLDLK